MFSSMRAITLQTTLLICWVTLAIRSQAAHRAFRRRSHFLVNHHGRHARELSEGEVPGFQLVEMSEQKPVRSRRRRPPAVATRYRTILVRVVPDTVYVNDASSY
eukprot:scaffold431818_cov34-Prasinocladus_malaysianus.AAC.1